ncbi:Gibberellin 3-beta-dioxygenase 1 [Acorus calamus]|uniref:Gibberellin 3-beta-dioxygenase 1 n=1 Tax=Acorus calamus TaxID=4465 RepID=A0AAV9C4G0_ACOCL|nr:Gibberellin 3-beta-dioxygenase 1 [Acorus calamus]
MVLIFQNFQSAFPPYTTHRTFKPNMADTAATSSTTTMPSPPPPPPTPSNHHEFHSLSSVAADSTALSRALLRHHHLTPTLSLPSRRLHRPPPPTTPPPPPPISLSEHKTRPLPPNPGFFHITHHGIQAHLAKSAKTEAETLLRNRHPLLSRSCLGFDDNGNEDEYDNQEEPCMVFDIDNQERFSPGPLREYAEALERLSIQVMDTVSRSGGFDNPCKGAVRPRCLMWVSSSHPGNDGDEVENIRRHLFYPYIVGLQYELECSRYWLLSDSGWVSTAAQPNSVLVTVGDISQVWSNGRLQKVRGRPMPSREDTRVSVTLLVTLNTDSVISPLPRVVGFDDGEEGGIDDAGEDLKFCSIIFEEYAWRVYHERLPFKDPLNRYRILDSDDAKLSLF